MTGKMKKRVCVCVCECIRQERRHGSNQQSAVVPARAPVSVCLLDATWESPIQTDIPLRSLQGELQGMMGNNDSRR